MLLPTFVAVLGRWNGWMPSWAARLLRVPPYWPPPERRGEVPLGLDAVAEEGTRPARALAWRPPEEEVDPRHQAYARAGSASAAESWEREVIPSLR